MFLYNIDDLQATVRENLARRASEVTRAERIVEEEVDKFVQWLRARGAVPTVVALRQRFDAVRRSEVDRLASTLPPDARSRIDDITRLVVEKLLLTPTEQLKSVGDPETATLYAEAISRVFNLADGTAEKDSGLVARDPAVGARDPESEVRENRVEPFSRAKSRPGQGRSR